MPPTMSAPEARVTIHRLMQLAAQGRRRVSADISDTIDADAELRAALEFYDNDETWDVITERRAQRHAYRRRKAN